MKQKLLILFALMGFFTASAQSIGIIGSATPTGWDSDTDMETTDNVNYTITMTFTNGDVKFRENDSWTTNWGGGSFPGGTATLNGNNITGVLAGTYTVAFNRNTGVYSFTGSSAFPLISLIGDAVAGWDTDVDMMTTDGINYTLSGFTFMNGEAKFREGHSWDGNNWGGTSFPSGTATLGGGNIQVTAGTYTVTFNRNTGDYNFGYSSIGLIGDAAMGWDTDVDMTTTDGIVYSLLNYTLGAGAVKFRQDDMWTTNWGGATTPAEFPIGTAALGGSDIPVVPGTYDIFFNRETLQYSFTTAMAVNSVERTAFSISPNPAAHNWTITASNSISNIVVYDISGKQVLSLSPQTDLVSIDGSSLNSGMYFAKATSAGGTQTLKLIKI